MRQRKLFIQKRAHLHFTFVFGALANCKRENKGPPKKGEHGKHQKGEPGSTPKKRTSKSFEGRSATFRVQGLVLLFFLFLVSSFLFLVSFFTLFFIFFSFFFLFLFLFSGAQNLILFGVNCCTISFEKIDFLRRLGSTLGGLFFDFFSIFSDF